MKILVVHYFDDNFGDMLIGTCFNQLLKVTLKNLGVKNDEYDITRMHLKSVDEELIKSSDFIFFAGGGLFGESYLGFSEPLGKILEIADSADIPVVFSSMGVNNMGADEKTDDAISGMLGRKCIRAISVRENTDFFDRYITGDDVEIRQVCDPVVWAGCIYDSMSDRNKTSGEKDSIIVGINVVRGGLFKDNGRDWLLDDELGFIKEMTDILDEKGVRYLLYTNGSFLDNQTLKQYVYRYDPPNDKYTFVRTSRRLVEVISGLSSVLSIRMHSSILSYSMGVPSYNLVWNDKIPFFYQAIGQSDRALGFDGLDARGVVEKLTACASAEYDAPSKDYMMSLYKFLFGELKALLGKQTDEMFDFDKIVEELKAISGEIDTDPIDSEYYTIHGENRYAELFRKGLERRDRVVELKEKVKARDEKIKARDEKIREKNERINELKEKVKNKNEIIQRQKEEIEWLNSRMVMKVYRKLGGGKSAKENDKPEEKNESEEK